MTHDADLGGLLARVALGDRPSFRRLYEATAPSLLGVAHRILKDRARAEDAVQDAFVNVWQRAGSYRESAGTPFGWLAAIVRNRALDALRSRARHAEEVFGDDEDPTSEVADERPDPLGLLTQAADAQS